MRKQIVLALAAAVLTTAAAAAQTTPQPTRQPGASDAGKNVTVTGCVAAGPNNTFTLTPSDTASKEAPTGTAGATPTGSPAKAITYTLSSAKPDELKAEVGHTVQVTGIEAEAGAGAAGTAGTTGTAGGARPSETAQMHRLTVSDVKMISSSCSPAK
jgi:hypothetical protein